ncbi:MAG: helix-turn-helix transcriptional regulator [Acidobacteria bacterium]|nr:helix-turn-helix transcriptional regulator [Acidobacteriota bacterium]
MSHADMPDDIPPLTPAVFHVLLALTGGDRHGYAILKDIRQRTDGRMTMQAGTLYGTLQRLLDLGWVDEIDPPDDEADARRRYYRLNREGRTAIQADVQRMEDLVKAARVHLRPRRA